MDDETYKKRLYDFIIHVTEHPKSFLKLTSLHLCWLFLINTQVAPSGLKNKIKKIKKKKKKGQWSLKIWAPELLTPFHIKRNIRWPFKNTETLKTAFIQ